MHDGIGHWFLCPLDSRFVISRSTDFFDEAVVRRKITVVGEKSIVSEFLKEQYLQRCFNNEAIK